MLVSNENSGCGCNCSSGLGCLCGCEGLGAFALTSPSTWTGTQWLMVGGGLIVGLTLIDFLFRGRPRRR